MDVLLAAEKEIRQLIDDVKAAIAKHNQRIEALKADQTETTCVHFQRPRFVPMTFSAPHSHHLTQAMFPTVHISMSAPYGYKNAVVPHDFRLTPLYSTHAQINH